MSIKNNIFPLCLLHGGGGKQWSELIHNGPMFPSLYEPHNIPIKINGNTTKLNSLAEEYITMYARYIDTEYSKNSRFNKNFLYDWKKVLDRDIKVESMDIVDVGEIKKHLEKIKEENKNMTKEMKERKKKEMDTLDEPYKYCYIDGGKQKVGNFKIEPPGIFLGRGEHPKLGRIKKRINPEDVTINISRTAPIPKPNVPGKWKEVMHNMEVVWLATWVDNISDKNKYVFTSMESIFKSKSDMDKFDLAHELKNKANTIRVKYYVDMKNTGEDSIIPRQHATALYLIDNLALRVGGKKDTSEKADTVGVTSLRVEHITFLEDDIIKLDFLGKDSVRYCKKVKIDNIAYNNIKDFVTNKNRKDLLFDRISPSSLNQYLDSMMKGLTAKVWRTYNASILFQKELYKVDQNKLNKLPEGERINYLISIFNQANTSVAVLCNHQKNVSSSIETTLDKIDNMVKKLKDSKLKLKKRKSKKGSKDDKMIKIKKIEGKIEILKMKKDTKIKMKNVSLGTSKNNYIDPRIIFAFMKKYNIPDDKLFNKALLTRFEWAQNVSSDYTF
jgi:DNA topoisomerase-1